MHLIISVLHNTLHQTHNCCHPELVWILHREFRFHNNYYRKNHILHNQHKKILCATEITETEVNHFFNVEIGIPEPTMVKLQEEGINRPEDLVNFIAEDTNIVAEGLKKPGGSVLTSRGNTSVLALASAPGVRIEANALMCSQAAMHIMKCYKTVKVKPTSILKQCDTIIKKFKLDFYAIKERKTKEASATRVSQNLDVKRRTKTLLDFLSRYFDQETCI